MNVQSGNVQKEMTVVHVRSSLVQCNKPLQLLKVVYHVLLKKPHFDFMYLYT
jgi:hypothetical protein